MSKTKSVSLLVVGTVFGAALVSGTAYAATGGTFVLGRSNAATTQTTLTNRGSGPTLALSTRAGQVPLAVSAQAGKATNLNADKVDGLDSTQLQRRTSAACDDGFFLAGLTPAGGSTCTGAVYDFIAEPTRTDTNGVALVECDSGYTSISGSYLLPGNSVAILNGALAYEDDQGIEGYSVRLLNVDGTPYQGDVTVTVACVSIVDEGDAQRVAAGAGKRGPLQ